jgi:hypothetical protein
MLSPAFSRFASAKQPLVIYGSRPVPVRHFAHNSPFGVTGQGMQLTLPVDDENARRCSSVPDTLVSLPAA